MPMSTGPRPSRVNRELAESRSGAVVVVVGVGGEVVAVGRPATGTVVVTVGAGAGAAAEVSRAPSPSASRAYPRAAMTAAPASRAHGHRRRREGPIEGSSAVLSVSAAGMVGPFVSGGSLHQTAPKSPPFHRRVTERSRSPA